MAFLLSKFKSSPSTSTSTPSEGSGTNSNVESYTKTFISAVASVTLSVVAVRIADHLPDIIDTCVFSQVRALSTKLSSQITVIIRDSDGLTPNQMFESAAVFLGDKLVESMARIDVRKPAQEEELDVSMDTNQEVVDLFMGRKMKWVLSSSEERAPQTRGKTNQSKTTAKSEIREFKLQFNKKDRSLVLKQYLPYILKKAKTIREDRKSVKLHTVNYSGPDYWGAIRLNHPASFDTIAMDPDQKAALIEDLDWFMGAKEYYSRTGRAWKRGYLLYGPPGTGKSSLVAAMANYLKFDVYDLELSEVQCDSDLRRLLIGTGNRSITVIEDIDRATKQQSELPQNQDSNTEMTLSGLLNFVDGLWSCSGEQRIIIFTTNNKDKLDPALLRPGRMDLHIHMSYCTFDGFKMLARTYLETRQHPLFGDIEEMFGRGVKATAAEVAGELMKFRDTERALQGLRQFLHSKLSEEAQQGILNLNFSL